MLRKRRYLMESGIDNKRIDEIIKLAMKYCSDSKCRDTLKDNEASRNIAAEYLRKGNNFMGTKKKTDSFIASQLVFAIQDVKDK